MNNVEFDSYNWFKKNYSMLSKWTNDIEYVTHGDDMQTFKIVGRNTDIISIQRYLKYHINEILFTAVFGVYRPYYMMSGFVEQMKRLPTNKDVCGFCATKFCVKKIHSDTEFISICKLKIYKDQQNEKTNM